MNRSTNKSICLTVSAKFATHVAPSPRVCRIATMFGLGVDDAQTHTVLPPTKITLRPGQLLYLTGPSGSGKSTCLRQIRKALRRRKHIRTIEFDSLLPQDSNRHANRPLIEQIGKTQQQAVHCLAMAGLGDAFVMLRKPSQLSEGQNYRWKLAKCIDAVQNPQSQNTRLTVVIADEFGSTLDRQTAAIVSRNIAKWTRRANICFLAATAHEDLLSHLRPDTIVRTHLDGRIRVREQPHDAMPQRDDAQEFVIDAGRMEDYHALAPFHYLPGSPVAVTRILTMRQAEQTTGTGPAVIGVLVETMPRLACVLRDHATNERYASLSQQQRAALLNREMRTISRVIVHPQFRGLGLAVRLVQHALRTATTPYTEAIAAMGRVHPFFARAGMQPYERPPLRRDQRLLDAMASVGIQSWEIAANKRMQKHLQQPLLRDELARWAGRSLSIPQQLGKARAKLLHEPIYYLHRAADASTAAITGQTTEAKS